MGVREIVSNCAILHTSRHSDTSWRTKDWGGYEQAIIIPVSYKHRWSVWRADEQAKWPILSCHINYRQLSKRDPIFLNHVDIKHSDKTITRLSVLLPVAKSLGCVNRTSARMKQSLTLENILCSSAFYFMLFWLCWINIAHICKTIYFIYFFYFRIVVSVP